MRTLAQKDLQCFKCNLKDCLESSKNCKRNNFIKEERIFKNKQNKHKMTSICKIEEPIVVR